MKKRLFTLFAMVLLVLTPALFLVGCGGNKGNVSVSYVTNMVKDFGEGERYGFSVNIKNETREEFVVYRDNFTVRINFENDTISPINEKAYLVYSSSEWGNLTNSNITAAGSAITFGINKNQEQEILLVTRSQFGSQTSASGEYAENKVSSIQLLYNTDVLGEIFVINQPYYLG